MYKIGHCNKGKVYSEHDEERVEQRFVKVDQVNRSRDINFLSKCDYDYSSVVGYLEKAATFLCGL